MPRSSLPVLLLLFGLSAAVSAQEAPPPPPDLKAPPAEAERSDTGLAWRVLDEGEGEEHPAPGDFVEVHYTGWLADGSVFDSSEARGASVVLPLDVLIPGWIEGLRGMVEGERRRLWIPEALAYGGAEGKPAGMLVFDVSLLEILRMPPTPEDVAEIPADAERSRSGLAWKVLAPGTGERTPTKKSRVEVHYTGWTTDGERFDSSIPTGRPASFRLDAVIKGWQEGLQLMQEGERRRFWIPKKLAYRGAPGKPEGMLVFDVELIHIVAD